MVERGLSGWKVDAWAVWKGMVERVGLMKSELCCEWKVVVECMGNGL